MPSKVQSGAGEYLVGDKVRFRSGALGGERGIVEGIVGTLVHVASTSGESVQVAPNDLTNYSLAARRAWRAMPKRAGRPKSQNSKKRMVSLRIEEDVWDKLGKATECGYIPSREQAINQWLKDKVDELFSFESQKVRENATRHSREKDNG